MATHYGKIAYETYADHQGWQNDEGHPLPAWDTLRSDIQYAWDAAAYTVAALAREETPPPRLRDALRAYWSKA